MEKLKISKVEIFNIIEWSSVFIIAAYMIIYGVGKPVQFGNISEYKEPISEMRPMQIMWAFYSYSMPFAIIIGVLEILGAILLIFPKTRLLGGIFLSFILMNIILQDIFFKVHKGALANAMLYQILIFGIFFRHRKKIVQAFQNLKCIFHYKVRWIYIPIALLAIIGIQLILFFINQFLNLFST